VRDGLPLSSGLPSPAECPTCEKLDPADVAAALTAARQRSGQWVEIYVEHRESLTLRSVRHSVQARADSDVGAAIRVFWQGCVGHAITNDLTRAGLTRSAEAAAAVAGPGHDGSSITRTLVEGATRPAHQPRRPADAVDVVVKADLVRRAVEAARTASGFVRQVVVTYVDVTQHVLVASGDGDLARDTRVRTRITCRVIARNSDRMAAAFDGPGIGGGLELFDEHSPEEVGAAAAGRALRMLDAVESPGGTAIVVLDPKAGGLLLHEACGHGLEADWLSQGTSVYSRTLGKRLAGEHVTVVDESRRPDGFGSYGTDDEGRAAQRTVLIDRGVQSGALTDRITAAELAMPRTANGRRESYAAAPVCRMSNTYLEPGPDSAARVLEDVRRGVYIERLSGGDVDVATGDFAFTAAEAHLIDHGALTRPVSGVTVLGNGPQTLASIDAIADDLRFTQAMCGKNDQWVPVSYGSPTIRVPGLTITGSSG
jgi:TldD protein